MMPGIYLNNYINLYKTSAELYQNTKLSTNYLSQYQNTLQQRRNVQLQRKNG